MTHPLQDPDEFKLAFLEDHFKRGPLPPRLPDTFSGPETTIQEAQHFINILGQHVDAHCEDFGSTRRQRAVRWAALHLTGHAQAWFTTQLTRDPSHPCCQSWTGFVLTFRDHWIRRRQVNLFAGRHVLIPQGQHVQSVQQYNEARRGLARELGYLDENKAVAVRRMLQDLYFTGLEPAVAEAVRAEGIKYELREGVGMSLEMMEQEAMVAKVLLRFTDPGCAPSHQWVTPQAAGQHTPSTRPAELTPQTSTPRAGHNRAPSEYSSAYGHYTPVYPHPNHTPTGIRRPYTPYTPYTPQLPPAAHSRNSSYSHSRSSYATPHIHSRPGSAQYTRPSHKRALSSFGPSLEPAYEVEGYAAGLEGVQGSLPGVAGAVFRRGMGEGGL
ncbi:hypothetical protein IAT38_003486 [Cryptococcus sp. DSM 104549]